LIVFSVLIVSCKKRAPLSEEFGALAKEGYSSCELVLAHFFYRDEFRGIGVKPHISFRFWVPHRTSFGKRYAATTQFNHSAANFCHLAPIDRRTESLSL
jgi:hypothetical protein